MWSPTHVQVVVQRARSLPIKGKHGTNDAFVTIQLGKEKFQTSVKEKTDSPEWNEECELTIPDGNTSAIVLTVLHRNFVGLDKFLGQVQISLNELEIYERARSRWFQLEGKPGKPSKKRGDLEVRISFTVKSVTGSLLDLSKKPKKTNSLPLKMVHSVGGSLMNLASKDKKHLPFKHLANYGHKLSEKFPLKKNKNKSSAKIDEMSSEADPEDDRFSQMSSYNSDEEIAFGIEQLSDDVASAYDYPTDSTPDLTAPVADAGGNVQLPSTGTDIPPPDRPPRTVKQEATDEWQSKLLGIPPSEMDRRFSVPTLIDIKEHSDENVADDNVEPLPNPQKKPRLGRNNLRRHTIQGIRSSKPLVDGDKGLAAKTTIESVPENESTDSNPPVTISPSSVRSARQSHLRQTSPLTRSETSRTRTVSASSIPEDVVDKPTKPASPVKINNNHNNNYISPAIREAEKLRIKSSRLLSNLSKDKVEMFERMSKEDLVELIVCQQSSIDLHLKQIRDLEDYIDNLLVRVMETTPRILQKSYKIAPSVRNERGFEPTKPRIVHPCRYL